MIDSRVDQDERMHSLAEVPNYCPPLYHVDAVHVIRLSCSPGVREATQEVHCWLNDILLPRVALWDSSRRKAVENVYPLHPGCQPSLTRVLFLLIRGRGVGCMRWTSRPL